MAGIYALDGALLLFGRFAPGYGLGPIEVGRDGVAIAIYFNFERFVAAILRVSQAFANDRVAHPFHKLAVHGVCHFRLVHPESVHGDFARRRHDAPEGIVVFDTRFEVTAFDFHHAEGGRFVVCRRALARHFAAVLHGAAISHARSQHCDAECRSGEAEGTG